MEENKSNNNKSLLATTDAFGQLWFDNIVDVDGWSRKWFTNGLIRFFKYKIADTVNYHISLRTFKRTYSIYIIIGWW